ncbi:MAG: YciI family protein [Chloroflexota bacterium]
MRYLLLIYEEPPATPPTDEEWAAMMPEYNAFAQWLRDTGQYLGGEALQPVTDATTVSVRDGRRIVTDGPFAETKEHLGGYYLIDAKDLDAAIEAAARVPGARFGKIEVRPIVEFG